MEEPIIEKDCIIEGSSGISLNIVVRTEKEGDKTLFIVNNEELGVADFGESLEEAIKNFKKSAKLYLETYPEKANLVKAEETQPLLVSRIFL